MMMSRRTHGFSQEALFAVSGFCRYRGWEWSRSRATAPILFRYARDSGVTRDGWLRAELARKLAEITLACRFAGMRQTTSEWRRGSLAHKYASFL